MPKIKSDYENFEDLARSVLGVSHSEIKHKLAAEKRAKKRKKAKVSSASREASDKG